MKIRYKNIKTSTKTSGMTMEKKIDFATKTLERNIGFVNSCDTKTSIVLAIFGVILTIVFTSDILTNVLQTIQKVYDAKKCCSCLYLFLVLLSIAVVFIGICSLISVLIGRVDINKDSPCLKATSKIFFAGITKFENIEKYRNNFSKMTEKQYFNEIVNEIFINSKIASVKYKKYNLGLRCIAYGVLAFVIMILIGTFTY